MLRRTRKSSSKICFCKQSIDDEIITCQTEDKANCPGNGKFHKSCIKDVDTSGIFICDICKDNMKMREEQSRVIKTKTTPKRASVKSNPVPSTSFASEEEIEQQQWNQVLIDRDADFDFVQDITNRELTIPEFKKKIEKVYSHHYINRKYKDGSELKQELQFKIKWAGYEKTWFESWPVVLDEKLDAHQAMKDYFKNMSSKATSTMIKRQPVFSVFFKE